MKFLAGFCVILLFLVFWNEVYSQSAISDKVESATLKILDLCRSQNYEVAASNLVYKGSNPSRAGTDVYNFANFIERKDVIETCNSIKRYLDKCEECQLGDFYMQTQDDKMWYVKEVIFIKSDETEIKRYFAFLKINGIYALLEIN